DPDNMPEGFGGENFEPNNIPDGTAPTVTTTSADKAASTAAVGSSRDKEQSSTTAVKQDTTHVTRPQMGSFPSMDDGRSQKDPMVLVLLGASALVLLAGLGFAFVFKR
ncbi:MAG: hypothetical protein J6U16_03185, partial [Ruminococcus sp.]|nr:hypothetical protein [Ruminococcus sp.]